MSNLQNLIDASGDPAKELVKTELLDLINGAKSDANDVVKESGKKIEKWLKLKLEGDIDSDELEALLSARRRALRQFVNTQEIAAKAKLEKITLGLVDLILNKALDILV